MSRLCRLLVVLLVVSFTVEAAAWPRWRFRRRARTRVTRVTSSVRYSSAQAKVNEMARRGRLYHLGGGMCGYHYEGIGSGSSPSQALANCCFTGQRRCAVSAVAQTRSGRWFAIKFFY